MIRGVPAILCAENGDAAYSAWDDNPWLEASWLSWTSGKRVALAEDSRRTTRTEEDGRYDRLLHRNNGYTSIDAAARCLAFRALRGFEWVEEGCDPQKLDPARELNGGGWPSVANQASSKIEARREERREPTGTNPRRRRARRTARCSDVQCYCSRGCELRRVAADEAIDNSDGTVRITLYIDPGPGGWVLVFDVLDNGVAFGGPAITSSGYGGVRTDFMDVELENYWAVKLD